VLLWGLGDAKAGVDEVRDRLEQLEPLRPPSTWLWNEGADRFGLLLFADEDDVLPSQLSEVCRLVGKEPDVYEEFDAL
jgi:hypothetical protein